MDERVVEVPLALEIADLARPGRVLDAGAALNLAYLKCQVNEGQARVVHYTQSADREPPNFAGDRVSFVFGDLRALEFADGVFDRIVCVSTVEHIGMDNRRYGGAEEHDPAGAATAVSELVRVLAPGGALFLTVPYGHSADFGWFRVFGPQDLAALRECASGCTVAARYFYYTDCWVEGDAAPPDVTWQVAGEKVAVQGLAAILFRKQASA
jgi:SAM-dependent methyltransferase